MKIYALPILNYGISCVQICEGDEPFPAGAAYPIPAGIIWTDLIIDLGVCREKTSEEKQAYQDAVEAQRILDEEAWQLAKSPELKMLENIYISFLITDWTPLLRERGIIPPDFTITVENTNQNQNIGYLLTLRNIDKTSYYNMAGEFERLKNNIVSQGGIMSKVRLHS